MHPLRVKFERELIIRGRSERTIHSYVASVRALSLHYNKRSPEQISDEEIRDWLHHLRARPDGVSPLIAMSVVRAVGVRDQVTLRLGASMASGKTQVR